MAKLITTTEEQWRLLMDLIGDERGVVLISPAMSKRMSEEGLITEGACDEIEYDFGGEGDVLIDFIHNQSSYAYRFAKEELGKENNYFDAELEAGRN